MDLIWILCVFTVWNMEKSKVYVTKRWHILALIYRILPYYIFKRL